MDFKIVLLGAVFGVIGQSARAVVGIKKLIETGVGEFSWARLGSSLAIGAVAGALTAVFGITDPRAIAVAGYAGTDAIEGLLRG